MTTAKPYRGAGAEEVSWLACGTADFRRGSDPAAELPKAAGSSHCTKADAGDDSGDQMPLMRGGAVVEELGKLGPRFLYPARGWQRAGCKPATAASPFPAAASPGSSEGKHPLTH